MKHPNRHGISQAKSEGSVRTLKKSFGVVRWIGAMSEERGRLPSLRSRGVEE